MSARDDYPETLYRAYHEPATVIAHLGDMWEEIDWLRKQVGELLARLATVATDDEWKRPI